MTDKEGVASLLDCAAAEVRQRGWAQGRLVNENGEVCALGGIWAAGKRLGTRDLRNGTSAEAAEALAEYLVSEYGVQYRVPSLMAIPVWNDEPDRRAEDVIAAYEKTAARVREKP